MPSPALSPHAPPSLLTLPSRSPRSLFPSLPALPAPSLPALSLSLLQGQQIDLTPPWRRVTMSDLVLEKTGLDFMPLIAAGDVDTAKSRTSPLPSAACPRPLPLILSFG